MSDEVRIERPAVGAGYCLNWYGIYEYSSYPESHPLAGQVMRRLLGMDRYLDSAKATRPAATWSGPEAAESIPGIPPVRLDPGITIEVWRAGRP